MGPAQPCHSPPPSHCAEEPPAIRTVPRVVQALELSCVRSRSFCQPCQGGGQHDHRPLYNWVACSTGHASPIAPSLARILITAESHSSGERIPPSGLPQTRIDSTPFSVLTVCFAPPPPHTHTEHTLSTASSLYLSFLMQVYSLQFERPFSCRICGLPRRQLSKVGLSSVDSAFNGLQAVELAQHNRCSALLFKIAVLPLVCIVSPWRRKLRLCR